MRSEVPLILSTAPPKPVTTSEHPERAREAGESKDESPHSFCKKGLSSFDSGFALAQDARRWSLSSADRYSGPRPRSEVGDLVSEVADLVSEVADLVSEVADLTWQGERDEVRGKGGEDR